MRFEARDLKSYAEPVPPDQFRETEVYFSVTYVDDEMRIPELNTLVFIGRNLEDGGGDVLHFQDIASYLRGVRYASATGDDLASFFKGESAHTNHIFEFEQALEQLMACSLRRQNFSGERV